MGLAFWKFKPLTERTWTAIDVGTHGAAVVTVRNASRGTGLPRVLAYAAVDALFEADGGTLNRQVREVLTRGGALTLMLAAGSYGLFVVPMPPVPADELAQSLRWSIDTMIDFPADEAVIQGFAIPTRLQLPARPESMYAVAVRRTLVANLTEPYRRARLPLRAVDIRETAQRNLAAELAGADEAIGLLSYSEQGLLLTFTYQGALYLDRTIEAPLAALRDGDATFGERLIARVAQEVLRSLDFLARNLPFMKVSRLVIAPLLAPLALRDALAARLPLTVEDLDLASVFDLSAVPALRVPGNQARALSALGAALRGKVSA